MSVDPAGPAAKIKHVFVLALENRSFDHMLGVSTGQVGRDGQIELGVGVDAKTGLPTTVDGPSEKHTNVYNGQTFAVRAGAPYVLPVDPPHEFADVQLQLTSTGVVEKGTYPPITLGGYVDCYGGQAEAEGSAEALADPGVVMACYTPRELPVLSSLAREFAVCDRWFSSMPGPTWPNRFFLHAATSGGLDRSPTGIEMTRAQFGGYRFDNGSLYETLDSAGLRWRIYCGDAFPQISALSVMTLDAMRENYRRFDSFHADLQDSSFDAAYVFIEPNYGLLERPLGSFQCGNSQHPTDDVTRGDALVKQVYEAIRQSPHWESSLLVITYDEHGGFYDHVPPPAAVAPGDTVDPASNSNGFTFEILGARVPAVVVSPWIPDRRGDADQTCNLVDHTEYDHASVLASVQRLFGLPSLTARDAAASDLLHLLSASQPRDTPRTLPRPADSGFDCQTRRATAQSTQLDVEPVDAALRGFVEVAAIVEARLEPQHTAEIVTRAQAITTKGDASAYLAEVAAKLRAAGVDV